MKGGAEISCEAPRRSRIKNLALVLAFAGLPVSCATQTNYPLSEGINTRLYRQCEEDRQCHMAKLEDAVYISVDELDLKSASQALSFLGARLNDPDEAVRTKAAKSLMSIMLSTSDDISCVKKAFESFKACENSRQGGGSSNSTVCSETTCTHNTFTASDPSEQRRNGSTISERMLGEVREEAAGILKQAYESGLLEANPLTLAGSHPRVKNVPLVTDFRLELIQKGLSESSGDKSSLIADIDSMLESERLTSQQAEKAVRIYRAANGLGLVAGMPHFADLLARKDLSKEVQSEIASLIEPGSAAYARAMGFATILSAKNVPDEVVLGLVLKGKEADELAAMLEKPSLKKEIGQGVVKALHKMAISGNKEAFSTLWKIAGKIECEGNVFAPNCSGDIPYYDAPLFVSEVVSDLIGKGKADSNAIEKLNKGVLTHIYDGIPSQGVSEKIIAALEKGGAGNIRELGAVATHPIIHDPAVSNRVADFLDKASPEWSAQDRAAVVGVFGDLIIKASSDDENPDNKLVEKCSGLIFKRMSDPSENVRIAVVSELERVIPSLPGQKLQDKALGIMGKALSDKSEGVRQQAADSLENFWRSEDEADSDIPKRAVKKAIVLLNGSSWYRKKVAKERAEETRQEEAKEPRTDL